MSNGQSVVSRQIRFQHCGGSLLGALFLSVGIASHAQVDGVIPQLRWKGVSAHYDHFGEIKPVLSNVGTTSIFLSRIWPHGSAQLQRFNDVRGQWESGIWSGGCGVVQDATIPIELRQQSMLAIHFFWQLSTDDWDAPKKFVVGSGGNPPLEGKYRLLLRYSTRPWTVTQSPGTVYVSISPEFTITK